MPRMVTRNCAPRPGIRPRLRRIPASPTRGSRYPAASTRETNCRPHRIVIAMPDAARRVQRRPQGARREGVTVTPASFPAPEPRRRASRVERRHPWARMSDRTPRSRSVLHVRIEFLPRRGLRTLRTGYPFHILPRRTVAIKSGGSCPAVMQVASDRSRPLGRVTSPTRRSGDVDALS